MKMADKQHPGRQDVNVDPVFPAALVRTRVADDDVFEEVLVGKSLARGRGSRRSTTARHVCCLNGRRLGLVFSSLMPVLTTREF